MLYWIIYDISDNKKRLKISEKCKNYGLYRVQKSAFLGNVSRNKLDMLAIELKDVLKQKKNNDETEKIKESNEAEKKEGDAVFIFPTCKTCFSEKRIEGKFDEELIKKKDFWIISG
ncbi:MAG: CRISPR-associated endonuclease Cas2 [Candidatus Aenigmarchaeota archaeon]|nr:CRISPR-associated endonuclease Cas2 [Candidatus Aenigmarchaeota archaeon]